MRIADSVRKAYSNLSPKKRKYLAAIGLFCGATGLLWALFAASDPVKPPLAAKRQPEASRVTNVDVMAGGQQVKPLDAWVGNAGKKMAQYERDKEDQAKVNKDNEAFRTDIAKRFADLEERLRTQANAQPASTPAPAPPAAPPPPAPVYPPASALPAKSAPAGLPPGSPAMVTETPRPELVRVSVSDKTKAATAAPNAPGGSGAPGSAKSGGADSSSAGPATGTVDTFLPVSFTRGIMLGGLDAPTGGNATANPHPVLIRLEDDAILPNRFRGNVKECFVIGAGYGDIASERAYVRTESLSCVRADGSTLEVRIQGTVYGEDGLVGVRGNLVTKQGQMLANALLAGLISGLGQGFASQSSTITSSTFGTISTTEGSHAFRQGVGAGVGRALDRLANYYIKLAETTFPVVEVGAGRAVEVVITKGVRIEGGELAKAEASPASGAARSGELLRAGADDDY